MPLDLTETTSQPLCNIDNTPQVNGTISVVASGGTAPYSYEWDPNIFITDVTNPDLTGLGTGTYRVVVTDNNGCTYEETYQLMEPDPIDIVAVVADPTCNIGSYDPTSSSDGSITIQVVGGTTPYTYDWEGTGGGVIPADMNQTGLEAGTYTVTVTDANGCERIASYMLEQPDPVEVTAELEPLLCHADSGDPTGEIDITPTGGTIGATGVYTYEWEASPGSGLSPSAEDQTGLSAGTYTVTVTDANGCETIASWTLQEPEAVECSLDASAILCNGDLSTITVSAAGGAAPYTYTIEGMTAGTTGPTWPTDQTGDPTTVGPISQTTPTFDVEAGTYTVTVEDANGCESTCDVTIDQPTQLGAGTCVVQDECQLDAGEIQVCAHEGEAPYTVSWESGTGGTLNEGDQIITVNGGCVTFTGAQGGETYEFTITDGNGCIIP